MCTNQSSRIPHSLVPVEFTVPLTLGKEDHTLENVFDGMCCLYPPPKFSEPQTDP